MYFTGRHGEQLDLTLVTEERVPQDMGIDTIAPERGQGMTAMSPLAAAARSHFEATAARRVRNPLPRLPLLRDSGSGRLRTVYKEIVIRFTLASTDAQRRKLLKAHRLTVQRSNQFVARQVVVKGAHAGLDLLDPANALAATDDVEFAVPNFVTEYRRVAAVRIVTAQWHLDNRATLTGQLAGEDVDARGAWKVTRGRPSVVVAIIDDGVDIDHPNLKSRIWRNPDRNDPDRNGRDFFIPDDNPDHFDPRPKRFQFPFDETAINDIHGTPCAGVVAAAGSNAWGIAPGCRILPVKIFHADEMAADERVADSIRYGATRAAVLSCSWSGARSPDLATAIEDAGMLGRHGLGSPVLCATGNEASAVGYPASDPNAIGVGASTDQAKLASYSNHGPEVSVVAPSGGGVADIFTADVSIAGAGTTRRRCRRERTPIRSRAHRRRRRSPLASRHS